MSKEKTQKLLETFEISSPFFGIPARGCANEGLIAAVSESGALGVLDVGLKSPEEIKVSVDKIRRLTKKPFALLLYPPQDTTLDAKKLELLNTAIAAVREELGLPLNPTVTGPDFEAQFQTVCDLEIPVLGLRLGGLREPYMEKLEERNIKTFGMASNLRDAKVLQSSGVNAVVLNGFGEPGLLSCKEEQNEKAKVDSLCLMVEAARAISVPVLAASSVLVKEQVSAIKTLGLNGLVLSDALLLSKESEVPEAWKNQIPYLSDSSSELVSYLMGRNCRHLANGLSEAIRENDLPVLEFPYQFLALKDIFEAAKVRGKIGLSLLEIGQLAYLAKKMPANEIIKQFRLWWQDE